MKKLSVSTLLMACGMLCLLVASCSKYKYEEVKGDPLQTRIYTLKNGMKVYLSVNKEKPRIQTVIAVRTGSKNDPAETTGLAHYLEHLLFKGTNKFGVTNPEKEAPLLADIEQRYEKYRLMTDPEQRRQAYHEIDSVSQLAAQYFIPNEYDKMMSSIGAEGTNAFTNYDYTCYVEDIPSNQVDNWLKVESERFQNMVIRGFHTELEAVYEEYNIYLAQDDEKSFDAMMAKLFPNHPYGTQTVIGTQEHLKNPSITNIKNYFSKWYVPNNIAICMSGDFNPDEVIAQIDNHFGGWQPSAPAEGADAKESPALVPQPEFTAQPELTAPVDTTVIGQEAEEIILAWRFDKAASLQRDTLQVVDYMLTNGKAGLIDLDINQQMKMLRASSYAMNLMDYSFFRMSGRPRQGQTLDEVRALLLGEIEKLKNGDFSDDLLPSVINNLKLDYYNAMEENYSRTSVFFRAFINDVPWEQQVKTFDRISGITKQQIVDFARRHLRDNYVAVYKRQGIDPNQKKIDKPAITPIPTNRDTVSQFVKDIQQAEVKPIEPRFVDFQRDLHFASLSGQLPVVTVENTENGRFEMLYRYDFGIENDKRYETAAGYLNYVGTDSLTAEQVRQQFYKLACSYYVSVGSRYINVRLSGLSENMPQAVALLEHVMQRAKADDESYGQYVDIVAKQRADNKLNQQYNFYALANYGQWGPYNSFRNKLTIDQMRQTKPAELLDLLRNLSQYEHSVLYYGPMTGGELTEALKPHLATAGVGKTAVPAAKHYQRQMTPENEILLAPYVAKNIYMQMYHVEPLEWNPDEAAVKALFRDYYGGSMNSIVFQELRESRGLAYNAYAGYSDPSYKDDVEMAFVHIISQNDKMIDCIRQFHAILDTIPQSEAAFLVAKEAVKKRIASQRTTKFGLISSWLDARERGIDYDENERIFRDLDALTLQDIVQFEQRRMAHKTWRYVILGDERELDIKTLETYGPIRRLSTQEIFGY